MPRGGSAEENRAGEESYSIDRGGGEKSEEENGRFGGSVRVSNPSYFGRVVVKGVEFPSEEHSLRKNDESEVTQHEEHS